MSSIDRVVANSRYAHLGAGQTPPEPAQKLAVLTCMDARLDIHKLLGLRPGDAHVIRNAGGRVSDDVVRSLALSQAFLGTKEVMVIHHTGCAMGTRTDDEFAEGVRAAAGSRPAFPLLSFADERQAVLDDVALLRSSEFLAHRDQVRGFLYDIGREQLEEVVA